MRKTGFLWNERYMWHDTGNAAGVMPAGFDVQPYQHAENPETKRRLKNLLDATELAEHLVAVRDRRATDEELARVHDAAYLEKLAALNESGGDAGIFTPMGRGSFDIARLAAGGVIELTDAVIEGRVDNGYALVRPPGHHAMPGEGMGFCLLANAAIAGRHALEVHGLERIAFVDWDVHHGNGTEAAFLEEPRALTISLHQNRCFPPDTGDLEVIGSGAGEGYNLNVPLPPGCGNGAYHAAMERVVLPALEAFRPEILFVPCGYDAGAYDPLGRQMVTSAGFRAMTESVLELAGRLCGGRIVMTHEGGYNAATVPYHGLAVIEALAGRSSGLEDPFEPLLSGLGEQALQPHQEARIDQVRAQLDEMMAAW